MKSSVKRKATTNDEDLKKDVENVENVENVTSTYKREKRIRKLKNPDDYVFYDMTSNSSSFGPVDEAATKQIVQVSKYKEGDIVWAKVGGHPWWPCIATKEIKKKGRSIANFVHFYGPIREHAWVNEGSIILYNGTQQFMDYAQQQVNLTQSESLKKKNAERYQLKIPASLKEQWHIAVKEADAALPNKCKYFRWTEFFKLKDLLPKKTPKKISKKKTQENNIQNVKCPNKIEVSTSNETLKNFLSNNSQVTDDYEYDIVFNDHTHRVNKLETYEDTNSFSDTGIFLENSMLNELTESKLKEKKPKKTKKSKDVEKEIKINLNDSKLPFSTSETYLIDRYSYAVRHIQQGLSVEEACNKYRISHLALLKCLRGGKAPRGKRTRLTESEELHVVDWLQHPNQRDLKYNDAIHLVFQQVEKLFEISQRPNPFKGKPSMDWWYDFLSRHPQIMASKPEWLRRGKVNDQYIRDVQSGKLRCTKFRRALLSAIQYIRSLEETKPLASQPHEPLQSITEDKCQQKPVRKSRKSNNPRALVTDYYNSDDYINNMIIPVDVEAEESEKYNETQVQTSSRFLQITNDDEDDDSFICDYEINDENNNPGYSEYLTYLEEDSGVIEIQDSDQHDVIEQDFLYKTTLINV